MAYLSSTLILTHGSFVLRPKIFQYFGYGNKNLVTFIQCQIDRLLWPNKKFTYVYINDIVIFS